MNDRHLDLLYRSFDSELCQKDRLELEHALSVSPKLQDEKKRVAEMRQLVSTNAHRSFKLFFSARVMNRMNAVVATDNDFSSSLFWAFKRIALIGTTAIMLLVANHVFSDKEFSINGLLAVSEPNLAEVWELDIILDESP